MALTVANTETGVYARAKGDEYETRKTIAFDSSYPTGGEPLTKGDLGFSAAPTVVEIEPKSGYVFEYDFTNEKILAYYGDNNNASDGPLIEVPNATNLATITGVKIRAVGKHLK
jgi:hypothetical protein